jgi:hypothetical protein
MTVALASGDPAARRVPNIGWLRGLLRGSPRRLSGSPRRLGLGDHVGATA